MRDEDPVAVPARHRAAGLDRAAIPDNPLELFAAWFDEWMAVGPPEPSAMVLATAGADGRPAARNVLLRGVEGDAFVWFTNYGSAKGRQLAENPWATLVFSWIAMLRQVVVAGPVSQIDAADSDAYWQTRPRGSQLAAWASPQSEAIPDRVWLEARVADVEARFPGDVPRPPHWGGYRLAPHRIEFWQSRPSRLHDRFRYERVDEGDGVDGWRVTRLAP